MTLVWSAFRHAVRFGAVFLACVLAGNFLAGTWQCLTRTGSGDIGMDLLMCPVATVVVPLLAGPDDVGNSRLEVAALLVAAVTTLTWWALERRHRAHGPR